jgi:hypothetical protein
VVILVISVNQLIWAFTYQITMDGCRGILHCPETNSRTAILTHILHGYFTLVLQNDIICGVLQKSAKAVFGLQVQNYTLTKVG